MDDTALTLYSALKTHWRPIAAAAVGIAILVFLTAAIDRSLSRTDRIRLERERGRLSDLKDAVLRYKIRHAEMPESLDDLIPGFIDRHMTRCRPDRASNEIALITWDPKALELRWSSPMVIHGLFRRHETVSMSVPDIPITALAQQPRPETMPSRPENVAPMAVAPSPTTSSAPEGEPTAHNPSGQIEVATGEAPAIETPAITRTKKRSAAPAGQPVVIEAEDFQFLTYGWDIIENSGSSAGRHLLIKEGVGDAEAEAKIASQPLIRSGDFYNVTGDRRPIQARYRIILDEGGEYGVYARTMASRSKCSNITLLDINGAVRSVGHNGSTPFLWLWHDVGRARLRKGINTFNLKTYQDGVAVDQVLLTKGAAPGRMAAAVTGNGPKLPTDLSLLNMSLHTETLNLMEGKAPEVVVNVHSNRDAAISALVNVSFGVDEKSCWRATYSVEVESDDELLSFRCRPELPSPLQRREYLFRCSLSVGTEQIEERTLVFARGFDWSLLGPLPYVPTSKIGKVERTEFPKREYTLRGRELRWSGYQHEHTDHFGILDFGMALTGRTFHATPNASLYGYTELDIGLAGEYLLKAQGDDDIVVWVNGLRAMAIHEKGPPIRTARETKVLLREGRNHILFRVNQVESQWQAGIRLRSDCDKLADVVGVPFEDQDAQLTTGGR